MNNMRGKESKGPLSTDLLVCFPARAHLTLMPKPICSPARPSDSNKRHHQNHNHNQHQPNHQNHHLRKLSSRGGGAGGHGHGHASPLLWSKTKPVGPDISEPTSPKVTCAGQIKVRPKASSCKDWQSVMEEIEKLHNDRKQKKKSSGWAEALGFKKDTTMQFLTCLRRIRFDFRCFGSFPASDLTSDDEEEGDDDDEVREYPKKETGELGKSDGDENSSTVFSKWFMVLQQEKNIPFATKEQSDQRKQSGEYSEKEEPAVAVAASGPPPNALLLMRCRSAPAKSWLEEREEEEEEERENQEEEKREKMEVNKEEKRSRSLAVVMRCDTDFYSFSPDNIAKETWVVGGLRDAISRSRSWKR